jgi:ceramide synthetase
MAALLELFLGSSSAPVDWDSEAYPAYGDFAVLPLLVAFFPAVRFLLDRLVFEVISCFLAFSRFLDPKCPC